MVKPLLTYLLTVPNTGDHDGRHEQGQNYPE
jgi:hypothetical protein